MKMDVGAASATDIGPLTQSVNRLDGVGAARAERLAHLLGRQSAAETRIIDLLSHLPVAVVDRRDTVSVATAPDRQVVTVTAKVVRHEAPRRRGGPARVIADDGTGELALVYFGAGAARRLDAFPVGSWARVSGHLEWWEGRAQIVHPDHATVVDGPHAPFDARFGLEPVYPLTRGLTAGVLCALTARAVARVPALPEWIDERVRAEHSFPSFARALSLVHRPERTDDVVPRAPPRRRLAYDELLASQLALAVVRDRERNKRGVPRPWDEAEIGAIEAALPFPLTASQRRAIAEIGADLASPRRMIRLLQGDVGAGKTMVALFAAAMVARSGGQTAMMAPTDLVARQHYETLSRLLEPHGIGVRLLTGRVGGAARRDALRALADGSAAVAVGTQALFQAEVTFADLALVVVDEQHRFGVHQRMALSDKGADTDLLVMTATPIPRTLVLAHLGDMDVSQLTEKPAGRRPIATRAVPATQIESLCERLYRAVARGEKAYWVCPLVEESEAMDVEAATSRHRALARLFGDQAGLVHGRTPTEERERTMTAFRDGALKVLVATTVIEVGVDVPDATIMVIEHAERFGLAQLHQLRGRVGRGDKPSTCLLVYCPPLGEIARARLDTMRATDDGFVIAERDLRLRGEGEVLGTRQSGAPSYRFADLADHADLLAVAADDARKIILDDRDLTSERGRALRLLLRLFERRRAIRHLRAG